LLIDFRAFSLLRVLMGLWQRWSSSATTEFWQGLVSFHFIVTSRLLPLRDEARSFSADRAPGKKASMPITRFRWDPAWGRTHGEFYSRTPDVPVPKQTHWPPGYGLVFIILCLLFIVVWSC